MRLNANTSFGPHEHFTRLEREEGDWLGALLMLAVIVVVAYAAYAWYVNSMVRNFDDSASNRSNPTAQISTPNATVFTELG